MGEWIMGNYKLTLNDKGEVVCKSRDGKAVILNGYEIEKLIDEHFEKMFTDFWKK